MAELIDRTGIPHGRLMPRKYLPAGTHFKQSAWECVCQCGNVVVVRTRALATGFTRSCSCLHKEVAGARFRTHGEKHSPIYNIRRHIIGRCTNPKHRAWADYGGRGIRICDGWRNSYEAFRDDIGPRPTPDHELDRKENDGHYSCGKCEECVANGWPFNVRWATRTENVRNTRDTIRVTRNGVERPLVEWCELLAICPRAVRRRLRRGWDVEKALTTPVMKMEGKSKPGDLLRAIWYGIIRRCTNPDAEEYPRYGGRGVTVCDRWRDSFEAFRDDMGPRPSRRHSVHRRDNDKPYSRENCEWATPDVQANERRKVAKMPRTLARRLEAVPSNEPPPPPFVCKKAGCSNPKHYAHGLCNRCYRRRFVIE